MLSSSRPEQQDPLTAASALLGTNLTPLPGGYSGETFLVDLGDGEEAVLRLFVRDPSRAAVTVGISRLVAGLLPVPRILEARLDIETGNPALVLSERLPGEPLDQVLAWADDDLADRLGAAVADVAVRLCGIPFARGGRLHGLDLEVQPWPAGFSFAEAVAALLASGFPGPSDGLVAVAEQADDLTAPVGRYCLAHSDFNPKNLLVDPGTATVTGLVDWEYAHAGSPVTDLGNLRRFDGRSSFGRAFTSRFLATAPALPEDPLRTAQAVDLLALIDLAQRHSYGAVNPVTERAVAVLVRVARQGRLDDP